MRRREDNHLLRAIMKNCSWKFMSFCSSPSLISIKIPCKICSDDDSSSASLCSAEEQLVTPAFRKNLDRQNFKRGTSSFRLNEYQLYSPGQKFGTFFRIHENFELFQFLSKYFKMCLDLNYNGFVILWLTWLIFA